jgi:glutathione S-transferase
MRLFQIPFSHNCVKVRRVLDLKGLEYETVDINPAVRRNVKQASGQELVPVLVDRGQSISGSTAILLHLEDSYPEPSLMPADPRERAECLVLMDWADGTFMALTRRLAYSSVLARGDLGRLFFPGKPAVVRVPAGEIAKVILRTRFGISDESDRQDVPRAKRAAWIAVDRLAGRPYLVGDRLTLADVTLAAMAGPLQYAPPAVTEDTTVTELLAWAKTILEKDFDPVSERPDLALAPA